MSHHHIPRPATAITGLAGAVLLAGLLAACGSSTDSGSSGTSKSSGAAGAGAGTKVSITQFTATFATLPEYVANRKGFFAENGIDATMVNVANGTAASQALLSGSVDMSTNSIYEILTARSKGEQVEYVAGGIKGGFGEIATLPDASLPHEAAGFPGVIQDLKGKRIGVSAVGAGTYYELLFLLQKAGMTKADVTVVPVGSITNALAALKAGQVDAFMSQQPVTAQMGEQNSAKVVYSLGKGPNPPAGSEDLMANGVVATTKFIQANPAAVKGVAAAIAEANTYLQGLDPTSAAQLATLLAPDLKGFPAAVVATALLDYKDNYEATMSKDGVQIGNDQLIQAGVIKTPVAYTDVVNASAQEQ